MKYTSLFLTIIAATVALFCTSISQKTSGTVAEFRSLKLDFPDTETVATATNTLPKPEDLSTPQLLALDSSTTEILQKATIEQPEKMADWAVNLDKDIVRAKVLKLVLSTWADQTPITCAMWTETLPAIAAYLDLYTTVASAWAKNNPSFAIGWALELEKESFRLPTLTAILDIWSQNSPDNAGDWLLFLNKEGLQRNLYPVLVHHWYKKSPKDTFNWLVKFKGTNQAGLDSTYLIQQWTYQDPKKALQWLASEYSSPFIDSLRQIAVKAFISKHHKAAHIYIKNHELEPLKRLLTYSSLTKTADDKPEQVLQKLAGIHDIELKNAICTTIAMRLIDKNKDKDAILFVEAAGFLTFPKLNDFFTLWAKKNGANAVNWFRTSDAQSFVKPLLLRLMENWNLRNPTLATPLINAKEATDFLKDATSYTALLPFDQIPLDIRLKFQKLMLEWPEQKKELFQKTMKQWAATNYPKCLKYVQELDESLYKYLCMEAMLPETKEKDFNTTLKMCQEFKNGYYKKNLLASLAVAISIVSPEKAFKQLKQSKRLYVNYIYAIIDISPKKSSKELLIVLRKYARKDLHILLPYYFYKRAIYDPKGAYTDLLDFKKEIFYQHSLRAIAAAYTDVHPSRSKKWLKSLSTQDKIIVDNLLSSTVENL